MFSVHWKRPVIGQLLSLSGQIINDLCSELDLIATSDDLLEPGVKNVVWK